MTSAVERTADGRYIIVGGRRWRASDPTIPEQLRAELVAELMRARRLVRTRGDEARPMVHDAKVALGERGRPWWETPTDDSDRERLAAAFRSLLRHRDGSTICPSDAARAVGGERWRHLMAPARDVARALREERVVELRQRGRVVDEPAAGPLRIGPGPGLRR